MPDERMCEEIARLPPFICPVFSQFCSLSPGPPPTFPLTRL